MLCLTRLSLARASDSRAFVFAVYSIDVGYRFLFQVIKHVHAPLCHANNGVHRTDFVVTTNVLIRLQVNTCTNAGTYFPAREPLFVHAVYYYIIVRKVITLCVM